MAMIMQHDRSTMNQPLPEQGRAFLSSFLEDLIDHILVPIILLPLANPCTSFRILLIDYFRESAATSHCTLFLTKTHSFRSSPCSWDKVPNPSLLRPGLLPLHCSMSPSHLRMLRAITFSQAHDKAVVGSELC